MKSPRNIPFGMMSLVESCQVLIKGEMPNGTKIDNDTRLASLSRLIPMLQDCITLDLKVGTDWINAHPNDSFVIDIHERQQLLLEAKTFMENGAK